MGLIKKIMKERKNRMIVFKDVADKWEEFKKIQVKESTYANYIFNINKYINPRIGEITLKELEKYDFNDFVTDLINDLSPKTIRDILAILKAILYYIEDEYECDFNIKKIKAPKLTAQNLVVLSKRERGKIENYCLKEKTLKNLGIFICLNTGLRIGEICALKWQDIDMDKRIIYVRKTLERIYNKKEGRTKVIIDTPKTMCSVRQIPISNKLYEVLNPLKKIYKDENFFLSGQTESFVEPQGMQSLFKKILKKCRIKPYKFHILRHTFATHCIEVGMDVKSLSEILGHSSVDITLNRYVHSSYKTKKKYLEKI